MADITVRRLTFEFPEDLPALADASDVRGSCELAGFSFTMPYLEPYLIRSMSVAVKQVTDPVIAQDIRNFSAQEGNHFRNHARVNNVMRSNLRPETALEINQIEADMEADYQRFTKTKSLKFNLAYAEGFEAMTSAMAFSFFHRGFDCFEERWARLFEWHLAEEVEHRTVTFNAYDHLYGQYLYRLGVGLWAQKHFLSYVFRFARCVRQDFKDQEQGAYTSTVWRLLPWYGRTLTPWYDPAKIEPSNEIKALWDKYEGPAAAGF